MTSATLTQNLVTKLRCTLEPISQVVSWPAHQTNPLRGVRSNASACLIHIVQSDAVPSLYPQSQNTTKRFPKHHARRREAHSSVV